MTDELQNWLESIWEEKPRPDKISTGQVWTVFSPKSDQTGRGTIVLILREDEERLLVVPVHHERQVRRGIDVVLKKEQLDFEDFLVTMSDCATWINVRAFERARFIGTVTLEGFDMVLEGIAKQHKIASNLSRVQYLEMIGEDTKVASQKAFRSGVMSLTPLQGRYKEFDELFQRIYENLLIASVKLTKLPGINLKEQALAEDFDFNHLINQIKSLNDWFKNLSVGERSENKQLFKEKKMRLLCNVFFEITKTIDETAIDPDEYKFVYDILNNIIENDPENHELAKLYYKTSLLGGGGKQLPLKKNIPALRVIQNSDRIADVIDPDAKQNNWGVVSRNIRMNSLQINNKSAE